MLTDNDIKHVADMAFAGKNGTHVSKQDYETLKKIQHQINTAAKNVIQHNQELVEDLKEKGSKAFEYISDYPLYASVSGITFEEGVAIAEALNPEWEQELKEQEEEWEDE